ncbi:MAG: hypothetical protein R3190_14700 [Thermoanaerobaculia bacterium]|nr:hypothetical protein [Thermoanaerobaculia bacterium]
MMPAALDDPPAVGAKLVTVYERNHDRGLPSHLATIVLLDHETGALAALVDGRYITEARTAAVSAVSARHLARPDASILAVIGSGVQARSHLDALRHVRPLCRELRALPLDLPVAALGEGGVRSRGEDHQETQREHEALEDVHPDRDQEHHVDQQEQELAEEDRAEARAAEGEHRREDDGEEKSQEDQGPEEDAGRGVEGAEVVLVLLERRGDGVEEVEGRKAAVFAHGRRLPLTGRRSSRGLAGGLSPF